MSVRSRLIAIFTSVLVIAILTPMTSHAALPGVLSFTPSTLLFYDQGVGTTSAPQTIIIQSHLGPVHIEADTGSISPGSDFELASSDCANRILGPEETCTIAIQFHPLSEGMKTGTLTIHSDAGNNGVIMLRGGGSSSSLRASIDGQTCGEPCLFEFGAQSVGTESEAMIVGVTVSGLDPVRMARASTFLDGDHRDHFTVTSECDGLTLEPSESCNVSIRFKPRWTGWFGRVTLSFLSDALSSPQVYLEAQTIGPNSAPQDVTGTAAFRKARLSWSPVSGAVGYIVLSRDGREIGRTSDTYCDITDLLDDADYSFAVKALNQWAAGPRSAFVSIRTLPDLATATLTPAASHVSAGQTVTMSAAGSTSLSGRPVTYEWDPGTGSFSPGGPTWSGVFNTPGTKTIRVRATSATGQSDIATANLEVLPDVATARLTPATSAFLTGQTASLSATASTSLSGRPVTFEWDPGTGFFTSGEATWSGTWNTPGTRTIRVRVTSPTGQSDIASAAVEIFPASPRQPGISINGGLPYTNSPDVSLSLGWPDWSTRVRLSNDGGFTPSTFSELAPDLNWKMDDTVDGTYTKIVYARYVGQDNSESITYFDDVIFDNTPPELTAVSASPRKAGAASATATVQNRKRSWTIRTQAKDNRTGVSALQASAKRSAGSAQTVAYQKKAKVTVKSNRALWVRVQDGAGNWTPWKKAKIKR
jgi:hypothetical protein